jgi:CheY-like chemotaxis protein
VKGADLQSHHVVVIGDDSDLRVLSRKILEGEGCRVTVGTVPDSELAMLGTSVPDLILFDLHVGDAAASTMFLARCNAASPMGWIPLLVCSAQHTLRCRCGILAGSGGQVVWLAQRGFGTARAWVPATDPLYRPSIGEDQQCRV